MKKKERKIFWEIKIIRIIPIAISRLSQRQSRRLPRIYSSILFIHDVRVHVTIGLLLNNYFRLWVIYGRKNVF